MLEPLINRPYSEIYVWPRPLPCVAQASTDEDGRLRTVYPSIRPCGQWTEIWAQADHLMDKFGRWTKIIIWRWTNGPFFFTMDRPPHGRIRTMDQDNNFEVDQWPDFWLHGRVRTTDDKHFYQMDDGGRVDGQTDETDGRMNGRSTNYFPWKLYSINGWGLGKFEIRIEGEHRALQIG